MVLGSWLLLVTNLENSPHIQGKVPPDTDVLLFDLQPLASVKNSNMIPETWDRVFMLREQKVLPHPAGFLLFRWMERGPACSIVTTVFLLSIQMGFFCQSSVNVPHPIASLLGCLSEKSPATLLPSTGPAPSRLPCFIMNCAKSSKHFPAVSALPLCSPFSGLEQLLLPHSVFLPPLKPNPVLLAPWLLMSDVCPAFVLIYECQEELIPGASVPLSRRQKLSPHCSYTSAILAPSLVLSQAPPCLVAASLFLHWLPGQRACYSCSGVGPCASESPPALAGTEHKSPSSPWNQGHLLHGTPFMCPPDALAPLWWISHPATVWPTAVPVLPTIPVNCYCLSWSLHLYSCVNCCLK